MKKRSVLYLILGGLLFSSITVCASQILNSNDIKYQNDKATVDNVQGALDEIYDKLSTPIVLQYIPGTNTAAFNKFDMRIPIGAYKNIYKHFKIIYAAAYPSVASICSGIYFNTNADKTSGNVGVNVEYNTANFVTLYTYVSGNAGCFYNLQIQLYN